MENQVKLSAAYDLNLPTESLRNQMPEAVAYVEAGKLPFSAARILVAAVV